VSRFPRIALHALIVGLAAHNLVMAVLWDVGVRGAALSTLAAWKEALLAAALVAAYAPALRRRALPFRPVALDGLVVVFAALAVVYALVPQGWLGGSADAEAVAYGLRHALVPAGAWLLGRATILGERELEALLRTILATAAVVAALGILDLYLVDLQTWRESGAPGWYRDQLGLRYEGLSGLPENFVFNDGDETPHRRLVSTFLSPLATAYLLVVALLLLAARPLTRARAALGVLLLAALLLTNTRAALLALAGALVLLAAARRAWLPLAAAAAVVAVGVVSVRTFTTLSPATTFTPAELRKQRAIAAERPGASHDPLSPGESSIRSHLESLRAGIRTVLDHPQGYGLGNAGTRARRTGGEVRAGESTYTEIGVELGLAGALVLAGWLAGAALRLLLARGDAFATAAGAALAAVVALALQTDVLGVHWLVYGLLALAGLAVRRAASGSSRARP
jgi:hypothetical protein